MTKRSTLLKVVSIIMIIFSAIALIIGIVGALGASMLGAALSEVGGETAAAVSGALTGIVVFGIVLAVIELVCGILGVASKNKKLLTILGCVLIILAVVSLIMNIVAGSFSAMSLVSLILPILYFLGARQCVE